MADYLSNIEAKTRALAVSKQWSNELQKEKVNEIFFSNLCPKVKTELLRNGWFTIKEILEKVTAIESQVKLDGNPYNSNERDSTSSLKKSPFSGHITS